MSGPPQRGRARVFGSRPKVVQRSPGGISGCPKMSRGSPRVALRPIRCLVVFSMFLVRVPISCLVYFSLFRAESGFWHYIHCLWMAVSTGLNVWPQMTPRQRRVAVDSDVLQKSVFSLLFCIKVFPAFLLLPFLYLHNFHNFQRCVSLFVFCPPTSLYFHVLFVCL